MRHRLRVGVLPLGLAVGLSLGLGLACGQRALNRAHAATLIKALDDFARKPYFWLQTDTPFRSLFRCETQAEVERAPLNPFLIARGWVRYEMRSTIIGFGTKVTCPAFALTPAGAAASHTWTRARGSMAGETSWAVPIGRRELMAVTGLTPAPDGSTTTEFDWKWEPNDIGTSLRGSISDAERFFDRVRKGRATCRRWDDGWRCRLDTWTTVADAAGEFSPARSRP